MDKEDVVCIYNGILLIHEKEQKNAICSNMDGSRDYHTKWSKSEKDKYHMISLIFGILIFFNKTDLQISKPSLWLPKGKCGREA